MSLVSEFSFRFTNLEKFKGIELGTAWRVHLFGFLPCGLSMPIAESGQEGDWGGGPGPLNRLIPILASFVPEEVIIVYKWKQWKYPPAN